MANEYKNIPVKPEVYVKVRLIADANNRGLGDQIASWVERELPDCGHEKVPVTIETPARPADGVAPAEPRKGWYCRQCKRVYVAGPEPEPA
jgi:hypothetical protein